MKTLHVTNPIHRSLLRRTLLLVAPVLVTLGVLTAVPARATPSCGVTTIDLLHPSNPPNVVQPTTFPDGLLDLTCNEINTVINGTLFNWNLKLKAKGDSDLYVTQHTFPVGAHTGWHTHGLRGFRPHLHAQDLHSRPEFHRHRLRRRAPGA